MGKILNTSSLSAKYTLPDMSEREININSNTTATENMTTSFEKVLSSAKAFGFPGESIKITLSLNNKSEFDITNVHIKDSLSGATFQEGSLEIDRTPHADFNATTGYVLPEVINAGQSVEITYNIDIDDPHTSDIINLLSSISYTVEGTEDLQENTNVVNIQVELANIVITKTASKSVVIKGDTITFDNVIKNNGNLEATNVKFTDVIPEGATFVAGSVTIDNQSMPDADPTQGISLNNLNVGGEIKVSFDVKVS